MASTELEKEPDMPSIDMTLPEEEFLDKVVETIGPLEKTDRKILKKDSFIKVFKYMGDYNKLKTRDLKKKAQEKRCEVFGEEAKVYLEAIKAGITDEEKAFEGSSR